MPRMTRNSSHTNDNNEIQEDSSAEEGPSSEQEQDQEVFLQPSGTTDSKYVHALH